MYTYAMPRPDADQPRLILASRSPRRRAMLDDAGIAFEVAEGVDDGGLLPGSVDAEHWVAALAFLKAWSVARDLEESAVVLGADTVCAADGTLLGKPADAADARAMLGSFIGGTHQVLTGVALVTPDGRRELIGDAADVTWGQLDETAIDRYIDSGDWQDKAGAYNLAERQADGWPSECAGDPTTVMGLPMQRLPARLDAWLAGPLDPTGSVA